MKKIVVHTRATPDQVLVEEREALDRPDIELRQCGPCNTSEAVLQAVRDADVALCGDEPYTAEVFAGAPKLKMVMRYGVGVDTVDLAAATEHGVVVGYLPDFCIEEVANHALALLLACAKKVCRLDAGMRASGWSAARAVLSPMAPIHHETVGLIAFGNISRAMARRCQALNMRVIAYDPYLAPEVFVEAGVESVSLDELAARSDYVSCHLPLTPETGGLIDAYFLGKMKPTAYFINTGRGPVVKEADLIAALQEERIAGAGLDVFEVEPISSDHPFCFMPQVTLTPHTASYADSTMATQRRRVGRDALSVLDGGLPDFIANPRVLDRRRS
jgi:D-3-phosphoglycerate dehydrogenase / 2-oxoglutarate reductase